MNAHVSGQPELLTIEQLAALMNWKPRTVYQRRYRGESLPPSIEVGRTIRFRRADVERWLLSHTTPDATGPDHAATDVS